MDIQRRLFDLNKKNSSELKGKLYKDRLKRIATKKLRTCFIAALAEFEIAFGSDVWGYQLLDSMLTDKQKFNKKKWEQVRKKILDKGNAQLRALESEIELYNLDFRGHKTILEINSGNSKKNY